MALSENEVAGENATHKSAPTTESSKPAAGGNEKREKPLTKIVIRRLPTSISKEAFIEQVSPVPDYDYLYLVKGDMSLGENAFSRAYINFVNAKDVFVFKEKFDNYVFVDGKGHEYTAVVEFAAFQKIPKRRSKFRVDPKCNSVETDPTYLEFLESLKDRPADDEKPEFSYQPSSDVKKETTTPLLEYIRQRRMDKQRIREEKREERKRREIERKKTREEDRRKRRSGETSPAVTRISKETTTMTSKSTHNLEATKERDETTRSERNNEKVEFKASSEKGYKKKYEERKLSATAAAASKVNRKTNVRSEKVYEKKTEYKKKDEGIKGHNKYGERETNKKESTIVKKVKKYSERREERKIEAQKAELKKTELPVEQEQNAKEEATGTDKPKEPTARYESMTENDEDKCDDASGAVGGAAGGENHRIYNSEPSLFQEHLQRSANDSAKMERRKSMDESKSDGLTKENESKMMQRQISLSEEMSEDGCGKGRRDDDGGGNSERDKENDPRPQRRIRNKDRPTMQIYKPGMLSKRRQSDNSEDSKN